MSLAIPGTHIRQLSGDTASIFLPAAQRELFTGFIQTDFQQFALPYICRVCLKSKTCIHQFSLNCLSTDFTLINKWHFSLNLFEYSHIIFAILWPSGRHSNLIRFTESEFHNLESRKLNLYLSFMWSHGIILCLFVFDQNFPFSHTVC